MGVVRVKVGKVDACHSLKLCCIFGDGVIQGILPRYPCHFFHTPASVGEGCNDVTAAARNLGAQLGRRGAGEGGLCKVLEAEAREVF